MKSFTLSNILFHSIGPSIEEAGKILIYLALSSEESLSISTINIGANYLAEVGYHVVSPTLPFHENHQRPQNIRSLWGEHFSTFQEYLQRLKEAVYTLHQSSKKIGIMGLSRGGLVGSYLLSQCDFLHHLVAFSPLTSLSPHQEFSIKNWSLQQKTLRFFIGHADTLVHTEEVIATQKALLHEKSNMVDLVIKPSIGLHGHGTAQETFLEGAKWLESKM